MPNSGFFAGVTAPFFQPRALQQDYANQLLSVLRSGVIPNLGPAELMTESENMRSASAANTVGPASADVKTLTAFLLGSDLSGAQNFLMAKRLDDLPLASIYLNLLAPTARELGVLWEQDKCDFNVVTLGVMQLQRLMRDMARLTGEEQLAPGHHHRILLLPAPGEDHTFGLSMLGEFFERAGWDVWGGPGTSVSQTHALIRDQHFDVAGISIADERWIEPARDTIRLLRRLGVNRDMKIMLGGPLLAREPGLVNRMGADATAADAAEA
ncbi:MAG: B12-binding domain-containing protein, partial [Pseudomonadales bacterium]